MVTRSLFAVFANAVAAVLNLGVTPAGAVEAVAVQSFEGATLDSEVTAVGAAIKVVRGEGVTDGNQALEVTLPPDIANVGVRIAPAKPWDCRALGDYHLSFDATNTGDSSVQLRCDVKTPDGGVMRRSACLAKGESTSFYFPMAGPEGSADNGMRDDPPALTNAGRKMITSNAKYKLDYSTVESVTFYVNDTAQTDVVVLDNLRFVSSPAFDASYLDGLVDQFGQLATAKTDQKVGSEQELKDRADAELAALAAGGPLPDRSRFGGWKEGPRLEATGYFRTEKVGDRWAMVDPEGYLYFATGIDNLRMANTSTFTGVDFKDESVRYRDPADVTPEDSVGIVPSSSEARETAYVAYPARRRMFNWLPKYDDPLAKYYGYRRSSHLGPYPHGEVFSFYLANLERRYGLPASGDVLDNWRRVTLDRMQNWGFTSLGNWTDASFYQNDRMPYFANGWIIGDFKTVTSGFDYWGPLPDPFDPEFARRADTTVRVIADEVKGSPWCVGVFVDNEKAWGSEGSTNSRFGIVINTLVRDAADSPTKKAWSEKLREQYTTIDKLNAAWGTSVGSWAEFEQGFAKRESYENEKMLADFSTLLEMYADAYFKTVHDALERHMPNHLYLGCRLTPWGMTPESRRAAARYADVMSYNFYREALGERNWSFLPEIDKPSIIGEFHMGTTESTAPHPGLIQAANQEDRGRMLTTYMHSIIDNPYFVGAHWFQYIDSPTTGRAHDGENYNVGFVTVADVPYEPLVEAARGFNRNLYQRRFGKVKAER